MALWFVVDPARLVHCIAGVGIMWGRSNSNTNPKTKPGYPFHETGFSASKNFLGFHSRKDRMFLRGLQVVILSLLVVGILREAGVWSVLDETGIRRYVGIVGLCGFVARSLFEAFGMGLAYQYIYSSRTHGEMVVASS